MKKFLYFKEPVDENPFLENYYKYPEEWAFHVEAFMMTEWQSQLRKAYMDAFNKNLMLLSDWGIVDAFIEMLFYDQRILDIDCFTTLKNMSDMLHIIDPETIFFLDIDVDHAKDNIKKRGRGCELDCGLAGKKSDYLELLRTRSMDSIYQMKSKNSNIDVQFIHDKNLHIADKIIMKHCDVKHKYIWITGIIGSGKSYICEKLLNEFGGGIWQKNKRTQIT